MTKSTKKPGTAKKVQRKQIGKISEQQKISQKIKIDKIKPVKKDDQEKIKRLMAEKEEKHRKEEARKLEVQKKRAEQYDAENRDSSKFYVTNKKLMAELIKWRDSNQDVEKRVISEDLANMFLAIAYRLTNHSSFRNYPKEVKEDMISYASEKFVTGIKNYNFKFTNPFAYVTQGCFNSFKTVLSKHYKQINIKRSMLKQMMTDIETDMPGSGMKKTLDNRFDNDEYADMDM